MQNKPLLNNAQLDVILRSGPELDRIEPLLSPPLRDALVELQRNAADAYAAGEWKVEATGETITVPESYSRLASEPKAADDKSFVEHAQYALGSAYMGVSDQSKQMLKSLMGELGLNPSVKAPSTTGRSLQ